MEIGPPMFFVSFLIQKWPFASDTTKEPSAIQEAAILQVFEGFYVGTLDVHEAMRILDMASYEGLCEFFKKMRSKILEARNIFEELSTDLKEDAKNGLREIFIKFFSELRTNDLSIKTEVGKAAASFESGVSVYLMNVGMHDRKYRNENQTSQQESQNHVKKREK